MLIVGVDTGGTFTDIIFKDENGFGVHKLLSTPDDPSRAVLEGLARVCAGAAKSLVHGSTVATNAILERKGAKTALLTNLGFEDVLEIGRQNRTRLYDLAYFSQPSLVPAGLRKGLPGRVDCRGMELEAFDPQAAEALIAELCGLGVESLAVCFLFSFLKPEHELAVREAAKGSGISLSLSHEILGEFREYERASTTVVNAYVRPKMRDYLKRIEEGLNPGDGFRIMQSSGGSISAATARREPVRTVLSGPAGGVVGALTVGRLAGFAKLVSFDMGGTSTDVSLIDDRLSLSAESSIAGFPLKTPMLDIHTVGAGGGSIAGIDAGGALSVGPQSAGASPGPICYGQGGRLITVTDANLYLGRLIEDRFLGGAMTLERAGLEPYFASLSRELGVEPLALAEGVIAVANAAMERAVRVISVERGFDPREFTLICFGGAGGLHAADLARSLGMPRVLVPRNPGIFSALGMLLADVSKDYSQTVMRPAGPGLKEELERLFQPIEQRAQTELSAEGADPAEVFYERGLDMRYEGQSFEILTPFSADPVADFHTLHEWAYGYRNPHKPVEVVNLRLRAGFSPQRPEFVKASRLQTGLETRAVLGTREVVFGGRALASRVIERAGLAPGNSFSGPAVLVELSSTTLVPPDTLCEVDAHGNLILQVGGA